MAVQENPEGLEKKVFIGGRECRMRASFWRDDIVRVQFSPDGIFEDTGLNRYGFILPPPGPTEVSVTESGDDFRAESSRISLVYGSRDEELRITDRSTGAVLLKQSGLSFMPDYAEAMFEAGQQEDWAGFGDQARDRMFHRGHFADLNVRNLTAYIPVPFFLSTAGYGVLANTTCRILFDMAKSDSNFFSWRDQRRTIDYYVLAGGDFKNILAAYTDLTGKPKLPPIWAFGLWYLFRDEANDWEVIQSAERFRSEGIPCDVLGLEPGWMEKVYDYSTDKKWHPARFPMASWKKPMANGTFPRVINDMGYKLELWLCNIYDLSYEAERRIGAVAQNAPADAGGKGSASFHPDGIADERLARSELASRFDKLTKPNEPWFEHLKKFVDQGASFFKMDASSEVHQHTDHIWGNGMTDAEMHNLYPLLYSRQMHEGYEEHANLRGFAFNPCGWAGLHAWSATWTGDIGGRLDSIGSILNLSFAAQSWNTNDMSVSTPEMFHCSYLLPLSQINGYGSLHQPWLQSEEAKKAHVFYSRLRSRLIPYIYSWAYHATVTGCPLVRPLPLEFPGDPACRELMHQYLLGRDMMISAKKKEAYFPAGKWKDFWTGDMIEGGAKRPVSWTEPRSGGLYIREGAVIPLGPLMQYRGEKPLDAIELIVFPCESESAFDFYEDDGVSLKHRDGAFAITPIRAVRGKKETAVVIGKASGSYEGQPEKRLWNFKIAASKAPSMITADGKKLPDDMWSFDGESGMLNIRSLEGPVEIRAID